VGLIVRSSPVGGNIGPAAQSRDATVCGFGPSSKYYSHDEGMVEERMSAEQGQPQFYRGVIYTKRQRQQLHRAGDLATADVSRRNRRSIYRRSAI
jgi:hypothetical protein